RLISHHQILVRHVFRRVEEIARMSDDHFVAAGQLDRSIQNVERFRLAVVHVQRSADSRGVRYLNEAEARVSRAGPGDDADFTAPPPSERLPLTGSNDDSCSRTERCIQLAHGHNEFLPFAVAALWAAEQNYTKQGSSIQSSE